MYSLLHCLVITFFSLDKPQMLMSLQRKHFRGTVNSGLQSKAVPPSRGVTGHAASTEALG